MKLILLRHGQTEWNLALKMQGWRDSKLTAKARKALKKLPEKKIACDVIYSSDLGRAMATARIVANKNGARIVLDKRLRERDFGVLSGLKKNSDKVPAHYWSAYQQRYQQQVTQVPEIECEYDFEQRITAFICHLEQKHYGQTVLLVSHGEWIRALMNINIGLESWHQGEGVVDNGIPFYIKTKRKLDCANGVKK